MFNDPAGDPFSRIARELTTEPGPTATYESATATAVAVVEGCDHAGITLVRKGRRIQTVAPTDDTASRADLLQQEVGEGPSRQSIGEHETVHADDLLVDDRWPQWSKQAADGLGIRSVLALQLFVGPREIGSLSLYSRTPGAFTPVQRATAQVLASHVAMAVAGAQEQQALESALVTRTIIGQAEGMLMQRLGITADQAFAALVRLSQARNRKLHLVAGDIVENGLRPDLLA
ncbi:GAF and ANTAR domain-containing protein [Aeromicrobium chenweiae]|nr:GAF and ANTAR domain-containing protein [Aeromicrobium chenweiae]